SRRRHTRFSRDWSSDVCSSDLMSDPANLGLVDELRIRTQLNIRTHLAGPKALDRAIARLYIRGVGMLDPSMQRSDGISIGDPARPEERRVGNEIRLRRAQTHRG